MTDLERKLNALNKCKSKLDPYGNRSQRVRNCVSKVETAFSDYIKSDNVNSYEAVNSPLSIAIEEHSDFNSAVNCIKAAIRDTEAAIEAERQARLEAERQAKKG